MMRGETSQIQVLWLLSLSLLLQKAVGWTLQVMSQSQKQCQTWSAALPWSLEHRHTTGSSAGSKPLTLRCGATWFESTQMMDLSVPSCDWRTWCFSHSSHISICRTCQVSPSRNFKHHFQCSQKPCLIHTVLCCGRGQKLMSFQVMRCWCRIFQTLGPWERLLGLNIVMVCLWEALWEARFQWSLQCCPACHPYLLCHHWAPHQSHICHSRSKGLQLFPRTDLWWFRTLWSNSPANTWI